MGLLLMLYVRQLRLTCLKIKLLDEDWTPIERGLKSIYTENMFLTYY